MSSHRPGSVTLTPTVPRDLWAAYQATPGLPLVSHLLQAAMRSALLGADVDPPPAPPPHPRTGAATAARSRSRTIGPR